MRIDPVWKTVAVVALFLAALGATPGFAQAEDRSSERPPGESPTRFEVAFYPIDLMRVIDRDEAFEADEVWVVRVQPDGTVTLRQRLVGTFASALGGLPSCYASS
jgi:hypothetical protein